MFTKKNSSLFCGLTLCFTIQASDAATLNFINNTIGPGGDWPSVAIVSVNNHRLGIWSDGYPSHPNKISMSIEPNKKINIQLTKFIFGNSGLHVDSSCTRDIVAKEDENLKFSIYGSPNNNVGFGGWIFCSVEK